MTAKKAKEDYLKVGRPTVYKPEYCQMLIEHGKQGFTFRSFCSEIGIHWDTGYAWIKKYPEFSDAKKLCTSHSYAKWEKIGMKAAVGQVKGFMTGPFTMIMKNCFDWSDNPEPEVDLSDELIFQDD